MTSQTYTFIGRGSYEEVTLEAPTAQIPHMGLYKHMYTVGLWSFCMVNSRYKATIAAECANEPNMVYCPELGTRPKLGALLIQPMEPEIDIQKGLHFS